MSVESAPKGTAWKGRGSAVLHKSVTKSGGDPMARVAAGSYLESKDPLSTEVSGMKRWLALMAAAGLVVLLAIGVYGGAAAQKVTVVAKEFSYTPNKITVKIGQPVQLLLDNKGVIEHDWVVDRFKVKTGLVQPGKSATATFTPTAKGTFEFYCSVPGHKEAGMKGTLVVQ